MNRPLLRAIICGLTIAAPGCFEANPGPIRVQTAVDVKACPPIAPVHLAAVHDERGFHPDSFSQVGVVKLGLMNRAATLESVPAPPLALEQALSQALARCNLLASTSAGAGHMEVRLARFEVLEDTGFTSEDIHCNIQFDISLVDPVRGRVSFTVNATSTRSSSLDATDQAGTVLHEALHGAVIEFMTKLASQTSAALSVGT